MKSIIIANWKMNLDLKKSLVLADKIKKQVANLKSEAVICPSFTALSEVGKKIKRSKIALGAQDVFYEESGAYTGEESIKTLKDLGCSYVLIGHSERRIHLGENDEMINKKIKIALKNKLTPVFCLGESLVVRERQGVEKFIIEQLQNGLEGVSINKSSQIIIAYEPIWAIGTGKNIKPEDAEKVFMIIRDQLKKIWPLSIVKNNVRLIYGGSVNDKNCVEFAVRSSAQGLLVGGASLKADEFVSIIKNFY